MFYTKSIIAQEIHFSQYNEQPALLNPALTGATSSLRVDATNRSQWRSVTIPYKTQAVSIETRFKHDTWDQTNNLRKMSFKESMSRLAIGISVFNDNSGDGNMRTSQANLSLASFIPSGRKSFFSLGLQASIVQKRLNSSKLVFSNQYNGSGYDANMVSGEDFHATNYTHADLAVGILWLYGQADQRILGVRELKAKIGGSVYHLNKPQQGFIAQGKASFLKFVLHGNLLVSLRNPDYSVAPSGLFQFTGSSKELLLGMLIKRYIKMDSKYTGYVKRSSVGLGIAFRNQDAIILESLFELKEQYALGISYDFNFSKLVKGTNARGGVELTLRYTNVNMTALYQKNK